MAKATSSSTRSARTPDQKTAINMTGGQLQNELIRICALVQGGLKLISEIADDDVVHAEELLSMARDNLYDLQYQCNVSEVSAEGGAA